MTWGRPIFFSAFFSSTAASQMPDANGSTRERDRCCFIFHFSMTIYIYIYIYIVFKKISLSIVCDCLGPFEHIHVMVSFISLCSVPELQLRPSVLNFPTRPAQMNISLGFMWFRLFTNAISVNISHIFVRRWRFPPATTARAFFVLRRMRAEMGNGLKES